MEKFVCGYCNAIYSNKARKLNKKELKRKEELKKIVERKHEEFLEKRKNLSSWRMFWGFLNMELEYLKTNDFDAWLFIADKENWKEKQKYDSVKDKTHIHQCSVCKKYKLLIL